MFSMVLFAQRDVTKFLGIPVDGSKAGMISKLKEKGFRSDPGGIYDLVGEFNGINVNLSVVTNNNKVYRIVVYDTNTVGERSIQIRFNKLCKQFTDNQKYVPVKDEQAIPDDEDIRYKMLINKKRYEAAFYQKPEDDTIMEEIIQSLSHKYKEEQLTNPTEAIKSEIMDIFLSDYLSKKVVWFMISQDRPEYRIVMFYDNEYNRANGEDL